MNLKTGRYTHLIETANQRGVLVEVAQDDDIFAQIERENFEKKIVQSFGGVEEMHRALDDEMKTAIKHDELDSFMVGLHKKVAANLKDQ